MLRCIRCVRYEPLPRVSKVGGHTYGWVYPGRWLSATPNYVGIDKAIDCRKPHLLNQCASCARSKFFARFDAQAARRTVAARLRPWVETVAVAAWAFAAHRPALYAAAAKVAVRVLKWMSR